MGGWVGRNRPKLRGYVLKKKSTVLEILKKKKVLCQKFYNNGQSSIEWINNAFQFLYILVIIIYCTLYTCPKLYWNLSKNIVEAKM